jgi:hypothetical protein
LALGDQALKRRRELSAGAALAVLAFASSAWAQTEPAPAPAAEDGLTETAPAETAAAVTPPPAPAPTAAGTVSDAIAAGHLLLEVRARYESVDQKKTAVLRDNANAYTVRTRIGWETADWNGFKGLIEFEDVRALGGQKYQVNVPGATTPPLNGANKVIYPLVNDPQVTEVNRAQITWTPNAAFSLVGGRQRILIDDQRFIGNVGWRQDEQTFDGVRADAAFGRIKATYAYITRVNRILGEMKDWTSDSHLLNVTWSPAEQLRLEGFVYALDFTNSAANSSITEGVKASGKTWVGLIQLAYDATYAKQGDYKNTPTHYDLAFWQADAAATFDIYTVKVDYESLEGNGTRGFTTPLATTHGFQGWADAFVQPLGGNKSFVDGIEDWNFTLNAKPRLKLDYFFNTDIIVRYHDFNDQRTGANLGYEWDAQVQAAINPKLTAALKYAGFERVGAVPLGTATPPPSRTKIWFTLEYKL